MLKSHQFDIQHANIRIRFYQANGGVSDAPYTGLNCGFGSNDKPENVAENRKRVAQDIGVDPAHLLSVHQYHSTDIVDVTSIWDRKDAPKADGMVTTEFGIGLGVLAADCGPILFADAKSGIIAAAHSGWRGAVAGINERAIGSMIQKGANLNDIEVFLGPMIAQSSYEVGQDVLKQVIYHDEQDKELFIPSKNDGKFMFDLPGLITRRAEKLGVGNVHNVAMDTYANEDSFFSYRRNTHKGISDYGRGISVIAKVND